MDYKFDDDIYTNDVQYFFSLHGPRFEYMNSAMAVSLSKKFGGEFRPIRILNAWPSKTYKAPNYIVLNNRGYKLAKKLKKPVVFLPDYEDVNQEFAQSPFILKVASKLRKKQDTVFVYPFTTSFLDLPTTDFTVLGPNQVLAQSLDNKINQFRIFKRLGLPYNNARIFESKEDLLEHQHEVVPCFISAAYTSGGNENGLIYSPEMLNAFLSKLRLINKMNPVIVSDIFENIELAPNVNAVVTSDSKVFVLVLSDQILHGNRYLGNIYPSEASENNKNEIYAISEKIGKYLAKQGYVGLFGCDFLINKNGKLVIVDINPRHQGGYVCNALALGAKGISLTDLELNVLFGREVNLSQSTLDESLDFAWSHCKVVPHEKGQLIRAEIHRGSISATFSSIGQSFLTQFYRQGSVFVDGYIGYQVHTAAERSTLDAAMITVREEFESQVLGL